MASSSPRQQLSENGGIFLFIVMSVAQLGTEITSTEEHLCKLGKVTKEMQSKAYLCILCPLSRAALPKKAGKTWEFFF